MEPKYKFGEEIERKIAKDILDYEWNLISSKQALRNADYESYLDMFDALRNEKTYKWQSNISMPEFATHMLVQSANDVDQYFSSLDFVETYVMDSSDEAKLAAKATKNLINNTLNRRNLYHYHKFVRAKLINTINGYVYARTWWEPDKDQFNYEILDPRNVIVSPEYTYSIQDKSFVIVWSQTDYEKLLINKEHFGYFNLNLVKEKAKTASGIQKDTKDGKNGVIFGRSYLPRPFNKYERFGKFWVKDTKKGIVPGIDEFGDVDEKARYAECVVTIAEIDGTDIMIGFHETPYRDVNDIPYRPIIRGLCYIHPENDMGAGDGKYARELQIGINDTVNTANDRAMLATLPTLKVKASTLTDNDSIFFAPGHSIPFETDPNEISEFKISDDIMGSISMYRLFEAKMQQVTSKYPPDMGGMPSIASTTATAIGAASTSSNKRDKYKDLTFENTFLCDIYWMIQQMTYSFALPETGVKLIGEGDIYNFNPSYNFWFKPISQALESEQSKMAKVKVWNQLLTILAGLQHPNLVEMINYIISEISALMGKEYENFADKLLNEKIPVMTSGANPEQISTGDGPSNEYGVPQSGGEIFAREGAQ